jgi:hypothetical protein
VVVNTEGRKSAHIDAEFQPAWNGEEKSVVQRMNPFKDDNLVFLKADAGTGHSPASWKIKTWHLDGFPLEKVAYHAVEEAEIYRLE